MKKTTKKIAFTALLITLISTNAITLYRLSEYQKEVPIQDVEKNPDEQSEAKKFEINMGQNELDNVSFQFKKDIVLKIYNIDGDEKIFHSSYPITAETVIILKKLFSETIPNTQLEIEVEGETYNYIIQYNGKDGNFEISDINTNESIEENQFYKIKTK